MRRLCWQGFEGIYAYQRARGKKVKEILESQIEVLKADRNLWEFHARQLAKLCVNYGMISRGRFAEIMRIDRCDVDEAIPA